MLRDCRLHSMELYRIISVGLTKEITILHWQGLRVIQISNNSSLSLVMMIRIWVQMIWIFSDNIFFSFYYLRRKESKLQFILIRYLTHWMKWRKKISDQLLVYLSPQKKWSKQVMERKEKIVNCSMWTCISIKCKHQHKMIYQSPEVEDSSHFTRSRLKKNKILKERLSMIQMIIHVLLMLFTKLCKKIWWKMKMKKLPFKLFKVWPYPYLNLLRRSKYQKILISWMLKISNLHFQNKRTKMLNKIKLNKKMRMKSRDNLIIFPWNQREMKKVKNKIKRWFWMNKKDQ